VIIAEEGETRSRHARGPLAQINRREALSLSLSLSSLAFNGREASATMRMQLSGVHLRGVGNVARGHVDERARARMRHHSRRDKPRHCAIDGRAGGCVRARVRRVIRECTSPPRDHRRRRFVEDWSVTGWEVLFQRRRFLSRWRWRRSFRMEGNGHACQRRHDRHRTTTVRRVCHQRNT